MPAQDRNSEKLNPASRLRRMEPTPNAMAERENSEHADGLADQQAERDAERDRARQVRATSCRTATRRHWRRRTRAERRSSPTGAAPPAAWPRTAMPPVMRPRRIGPLSGTASAVMTPASVAWTPDFRTQSQTRMPSQYIGGSARDGAAVEQRPEMPMPTAAQHQRRYGQILRVEERDDDDGAEIVDDGERQQEDLERAGDARADSARIPTAKAMSVAVGMAQPCRALAIVVS